MTVRGGDRFLPLLHSNLPTLGSTDTVLLNKGRIRAQQGLRISGNSIDNQGIIEVPSGGMLVIDSDFNLATFGNFVRDASAIVAVQKTQTNTGQTLNISRPQGWQLAGGMITGGTIATTGGGSLWVGFLTSGTLDNVTLNGLLEVTGSLTVTGTLAGNGTIRITEPEYLESTGVITIPTVPAGITIRGGIDEFYDDPAKAKVFLTTNNGLIRAEKSGMNGNGKLRLRRRRHQ